MFHRVSRSFNICFGYSRQVVSQTEAWSVKCPASQGTLQRRFYDVATAPIEADQLDNDDDGHRTSTVNSSGFLARAATRRRFRDKKWRPHPTAQLGVESLGQPAEVLILPTRDRRILQIPVEDDQKSDDGAQLRVQESLDSELKPVTLDQAKQNIDTLKAEIFQDGRETDDESWIKARISLQKGFSRAQLQYYVDSAGLQGETITKSKASKSKSRQLLVLKIMTQVWGFPPPSMATSLRVVSTKRWKVSRKFVDLMLLAGKDVLRDLSRRLDIKIDLFRNGGFVRFSGVSDAAQQAKGELMTLRNQMVTTSISFPDNVGEHVGLQRIDELARRFGVLAVKSDTTLEVAGLDSNKVTAFRLGFMQEISEKVRSSEKVYILSSDTTLRRVPVDFVPDISQKTKFRYTAATSDKMQLRYADLVDTHQKRLDSILDEVVVDLSRHQMPVAPPLSLINIDQEVKYVVSFGQALLQESGDYDSRQDVSKPTWLEPVISEYEIPFLSDYLAQKQLVRSKIHAFPKERSQKQKCTYRVRLAPEDNTECQPSFELMVSGKDVSLGLDQQLLLQSVFVCLDKKTTHILLPEHDVDLTVTKDTKIKVYEHGEKPGGISKTLHLQFNKYLATNARLGSDHELAPTVELSTNSLFRTRQPPGLKPATKGIGENVPQNTNINRLKHVQYVLESMEAIDETVYSSPHGKSMFHLKQGCYRSPAAGLEQPIRRSLELTEANLQLDKAEKVDKMTADSHRTVSKGKTSDQPSQPIDRPTELSRIKNLLVAAYDIASELSLNSRSRAGQ